MTVKNKEKLDAISQKLAEISKKTETMKALVLEGDSAIESETRELDRLVLELKALQGLSAFDKTAYQREYMRKKRSENPDYRPIIKNVRDLPEWRKTQENVD